MVVDREAASLDRVSEGLVVEQQNASYDVNNEEEGRGGEKGHVGKHT